MKTFVFISLILLWNFAIQHPAKAFNSEAGHSNAKEDFLLKLFIPEQILDLLYGTTVYLPPEPLDIPAINLLPELLNKVGSALQTEAQDKKTLHNVDTTSPLENIVLDNFITKQILDLLNGGAVYLQTEPHVSNLLHNVDTTSPLQDIVLDNFITKQILDLLNGGAIYLQPEPLDIPAINLLPELLNKVGSALQTEAQDKKILHNVDTTSPLENIDLDNFITKQILDLLNGGAVYLQPEVQEKKILHNVDTTSALQDIVLENFITEIILDLLKGGAVYLQPEPHDTPIQEKKILHNVDTTSPLQDIVLENFIPKIILDLLNGGAVHFQPEPPVSNLLHNVDTTSPLQDIVLENFIIKQILDLLNGGAVYLQPEPHDTPVSHLQHELQEEKISNPEDTTSSLKDILFKNFILNHILNSLNEAAGDLHPEPLNRPESVLQPKLPNTPEGGVLLEVPETQMPYGAHASHLQDNLLENIFSNQMLGLGKGAPSGVHLELHKRQKIGVRKKVPEKNRKKTYHHVDNTSPLEDNQQWDDFISEQTSEIFHKPSSGLKSELHQAFPGIHNYEEAKEGDK